MNRCQSGIKQSNTCVHLDNCSKYEKQAQLRMKEGKMLTGLDAASLAGSVNRVSIRGMRAKVSFIVTEISICAYDLLEGKWSPNFFTAIYTKPEKDGGCPD